MTDWEARIQILEEAAGSGVLRIESDGDVQVFRSMSELLKAIDYARRQQTIAASANGMQRATSTVAVYCPD